MKVAILITAYKNVHQIIDIVTYFDDRFHFYIHFDKKQLPRDIDSLKVFSNVSVFSPYTVNWGSINHLKAILFLCKEALKDPENDYFHLISGQDFPTQPLATFFDARLLENNYLQYFSLPTKGWSGNGGLDRYAFYHIYDWVQGNKTTTNLWNRRFVKLQKFLKIKRRNAAKQLGPLYGGGTWWSLQRRTLEYVIYHPEQDTFLKRLKYCFCSEELYFQTVLLHSPFAPYITNDNLRYIDWESMRGGCPAFLDATDYEKIKQQYTLFARKIDERSAHLLNLLRQNNK